MSAASAGNTAAQYLAHTGTVALITGAAAVSATGVGLVAIGGALTVGSMVQAGRSWNKTSDHISGLERIQARRTQYQCQHCLGGGGSKVAHDYIGSVVLSYIINQKEKKLTRKKVGTFGGGALVSLFQMGRALTKTGRGKQRSYYAHVLAVHLITHHCQLADAIVGQLYSDAECDAIKQMNSDDAGDLLMDKMKSG